MDTTGSSAPAHDGSWGVLIVDDEDDIHAITRLALRNKKWHDRPIVLSHAKSAQEAREILSANPDKFQVAFVDVIMETDDAGPVLASWIRANCSKSLCVALRTGQPDATVDQFEVDFIVPKGDMDASRIRRFTFQALAKSTGLPIDG